MSTVTGFSMMPKDGGGFTVVASLDVADQSECLALFTKLILDGGPATVSGGASEPSADRTGLVVVVPPPPLALPEKAAVVETPAPGVPSNGATHIVAPRRGRPPRAVVAVAVPEAPAAPPVSTPAAPPPAVVAALTKQPDLPHTAPAPTPAPTVQGADPYAAALAGAKPSVVLRALAAAGLRVHVDVRKWCLDHWQQIPAFKHLADADAVGNLVDKTITILKESGVAFE